MGNFFIGKSVDSIHEFLLPIAGINKVGVAVAPSWQHDFSIGIDTFFRIQILW